MIFDDISAAVFETAIRTGKDLSPITGASQKYRIWKTNIGIYTCLFCLEQNGKVFLNGKPIEIEPPVHPNCRCTIEPMITILAGSATIEREKGADFYLKHHGRLPDNYISKQEAKKLGWKPPAGNLDKVAPSKLVYGDYGNFEGKLPHLPGRIWQEADLNYSGGHRNGHRIFFSNDGLIFVSYDHGDTFYEIT